MISECTVVLHWAFQTLHTSVETINITHEHRYPYCWTHCSMQTICHRRMWIQNLPVSLLKSDKSSTIWVRFICHTLPDCSCTRTSWWTIPFRGYYRRASVTCRQKIKALLWIVMHKWHNGPINRRTVVISHKRTCHRSFTMVLTACSPNPITLTNSFLLLPNSYDSTICAVFYLNQKHTTTKHPIHTNYNTEHRKHKNSHTSSVHKWPIKSL